MMTGSSYDVPAFLLRLGLGFLWLWEGITKMRFPSHELVDIIMGTRLIPAAINIKPWVPLLGIAEATLGACLILGLRTRAVAAAQSVLITVFTIVLIVGYPELMYHPLGPIIKNFAILGAQLALWVSGSGRILSLDARRVVVTKGKEQPSKSSPLAHERMKDEG